ncbi:hypothetical protein OIU77_019601, partial [Salix suchowensis]
MQTCTDREARACLLLANFQTEARGERTEARGERGERTEVTQARGERGERTRESGNWREKICKY